MPNHLAWIDRPSPRTADIRPDDVSHRGQASVQAADVLGVDPGHQAPAFRQLRPRIRSRQLGGAHALHFGGRVYHRHPSIGTVELGHQVCPWLVFLRLPRDITHHYLVARIPTRRWPLSLRMFVIGRMLMDGHQVTRSGMNIPPGVRFLLRDHAHRPPPLPLLPDPSSTSRIGIESRHLTGQISPAGHRTTGQDSCPSACYLTRCGRLSRPGVASLVAQRSGADPGEGSEA